MADPLRHRQTKGAATDMVDLTPPRHIPTLPGEAIRGPSRSSTALDPEPTAQTDPLRSFDLTSSGARTGHSSIAYLFDIAETGCGAIGSMLINDVIRCRDKSGDIAGCVDWLSTSSKVAVSLLK